MRNTSIANHVYEFGRTYVGIGFVDLFQLAWGHYTESVSNKILTFYGYNLSRVTVLRSKLIYGAMKHFGEDEMTTRNLLQIWFSSSWDLETSKAFDMLLKDALADPKKFQLDTENDLEILEKWQKVAIPMQKAKMEFSKSLENSDFDDVWRLRFETDRVQFCRYLFNGCIFVDDEKIVCGNKTMFSDVCGREKMPRELFFKAIDLTAVGFERDRHVKSLFDTIVAITSKTILGFRFFVGMEKIVCYLQTKLIDPTDDMEFAGTINALNPYSIDWSNVPDYFEKNSFIRFARECSMEDTLHTLHFLNWPQYVFGAVHIDWKHSQGACLALYRRAKKASDAKDQAIQFMYHDRKSILSFFESAPHINSLNEINMFLAIQFRKQFQDFFLSDEQGNILTRFESAVCDLFVMSFFDQSDTMIWSTLTFSEGLQIKSGTVL